MALSPEQEANLNSMLADEGAPAPVAEAPAAPAPVTPAAEQVEIPSTDAELPEGDKFDRAYVEKLRRESAGYRDRAKRYNEVFEGYEEDAVNEWLSLASTLKADPNAAASRFQEIADAIRAQYGDAAGDAADAKVADAAASAEAPTEKPLTRAEFDQLMAEREKQNDVKARVQKIEADARSLGYETGTDSYDQLLWRASRSQSGSIADAHAAIKAERQAVIDAYVAEMKGQPAPLVPSQGAPASGERSIKTFTQANEALDAWLAANAG